MLLFHGTTIENAKQILKNGFNYNNSIWSCSQNETYFFSGDYFKKEYDLNNDEEVLQYGIQEALQQSMITLAVQNPADYRGAVLVFDSDLMNNKDEIEPDYSCENMQDMAVCLSNPDMKGLIGFYVMEEDCRVVRLVTLASMASNQHLNEVNLSSIEKKMMEALVNSDAISQVYDEVYSNLSYNEIELNINQSLLEAA